MGLAAITAVALAVRLVYALAIAPGEIQPGDSQIYHQAANNLADGLGYTLTPLVPGPPQPTSAHPPLFPLYLAAFSKAGLSSLTAHRVASCLLGAAAVALIGLLGRRVAGRRVGLIGAGVAAIYPQLFMVDGAVLADSLYVPLIALALLAAYWGLDRPTPLRATGLGVVIGLAALTRPEALLLVILLGAPVVWLARTRRLRLACACVAGVVVVLTPWLARNWRAQDRFPLLATNGALTAAATNCRETYFTDHIGFVFHQCALRSACLRIRREVPQADCFGRQARAYVSDHKKRLPLVVLARVARAWQLYRVTTDLDYQRLWARHRDFAGVGVVLFAALGGLAVAGGILLRRRVPLSPLVAPLLLATVAATVAFGFSRYRLAAEVPVVVLAAVAIGALASTGRVGTESDSR